jgi:sarcosine oxidase delta subunit
MVMLIVGLILLGLFSGFGSARSTTLRPRRRSFRLLAQRYRGSYQHGGLFGRPSVRFWYGRTNVQIRAAKRRNWGTVTQALLDWPDANLTMELLFDPHSTRQEGLPGTRILVGNNEFDTRFLVRSPNGEKVLHLLSDGVRWQVDRLAHFDDGAELYIAFKNGRITIEKNSALTREDDVDEFTRLSLELFDQAMLTRSEGIEFLREGEARVLDDPVCPVCGEKIVTDMVFCRRCLTPHHAECWRYIGSCSTFACQETRYIAPKVAQTAREPDDSQHGRHET